MKTTNRLKTCVSFFHRKDKPAGQMFSSGFSWSEAADAAADVYNGVGSAF